MLAIRKIFRLSLPYINDEKMCVATCHCDDDGPRDAHYGSDAGGCGYDALDSQKSRRSGNTSLAIWRSCRPCLAGTSSFESPLVFCMLLFLHHTSNSLVLYVCMQCMHTQRFFCPPSQHVHEVVYCVITNRIMGFLKVLLIEPRCGGIATFPLHGALT